MDGLHVEVQGKATFGFETSIFRDGSACENPGGRCTIWLKFDNCSVISPGGQTARCSSVIEHLSAELQRGREGPKPFVIENVTLRGRVSTVRKDVSYDKSVPASARVGFGHLSAYPAEIQVEQMELQKAH
jgi:hypothetical protein